MALFKKLKLLLVLVVLSQVLPLGAQSEGELTLYREGIAQLGAFRQDSAIQLFQILLDQLAARNKKDTPFGLEVRLRMAEALEKRDKDDVAIDSLRLLQADAERQNAWPVVCSAGFSLARLYEKLGFKEECKAQLEAVRTLARRQGIDSLNTQLYIRLASYHRIFDSRDSARYYAGQIEEIALRYNQQDFLANGYMLMGMLLRDTTMQVRMDYYSKASRIWKKLGNYSAVESMYLNQSVLLMRAGLLREALLYSDSSAVAHQVASQYGYKDQATLALNYQYRGQMLYSLGQKDSAWHYMNKGYQMELEDTYLANAQKIADINARYKDEQQRNTINEQATQLDKRKAQNRTLVYIFVSTVAILGIVLFFYKKLQSVNRELAGALAYQQTLLGEVHHRVKNNLQVVIGLLELQTDQITDPNARENLVQLRDRIFSISAVHQLLYANDWKEQVDVQAYFTLLCQYYGQIPSKGQTFTFDIDAPTRLFNMDTMMPLGIILNELLTNSLKYGIVAQRSLAINISFWEENDYLHLRYKDNGAGYNPKNDNRQGSLGMFLIESMTMQLGGDLNTYNDDGAVTEISFKAA